MHSSRMHTVRCSGRISYHTPHTCPLPCTPPVMHTPCHACPHMHAPHHAFPPLHTPLPCMPPATHAPNHTCPHHAHPLPHMPPTMHAPHAMHAPCQACPLPCMPPCHAGTVFLTHASENITFPQLRLRTVIAAILLVRGIYQKNRATQPSILS